MLARYCSAQKGMSLPELGVAAPLWFLCSVAAGSAGGAGGGSTNGPNAMSRDLDVPSGVAAVRRLRQLGSSRVLVHPTDAGAGAGG